MSTKLFSVECETGDTTYYVDRDSKGNVSISSDSLVVESAEDKPKKTTRKRKTKEEGVEEPKKTTRKRTTKAKTDVDVESSEEPKKVTRKRTTKAKTEEKVVKETKFKTTRKKKVVDVDDLLE